MPSHAGGVHDPSPKRQRAGPRGALLLRLAFPIAVCTTDPALALRALMQHGHPIARAKTLPIATVAVGEEWATRICSSATAYGLQRPQTSVQEPLMQ